MKTKIFLTAVSVLVATSGVMAQQMVGSGASCPIVLKSGDLSAADKASLAYRTAATHTDSNGAYARTSADREKFIAATSKRMKEYIFGKNDKNSPDTPEMVFAAAAGVKVEVPAVAIKNPSKNPVPLTYMEGAPQQGYHFEKVPQIKISGLAKDGILSGTLMLPVSGHTGTKDATAWAKTDTYSIFLENKSNPGSKPVTLANNVKSLDFITTQEISMTLVPGQVYEISYHRSGSGGPSGFPEGRLLEILWDGN